MAQPLCTGGHGHGFPVLVLVHLYDGIESLFQRVAIGGEPDDGKGDAGILVLGTLAADLEELGCVAGVDVVAGGGPGVASENGEVCAGDAKGGTAVVGVASSGV